MQSRLSYSMHDSGKVKQVLDYLIFNVSKLSINWCHPGHWNVDACLDEISLKLMHELKDLPMVDYDNNFITLFNKIFSG